ncbi:MAG: hypothetical protein JXN10_11400, partial [Clostridia bacterium]|nr:hypothetical protein [Clostridia bacterium]
MIGPAFMLGVFNSKYEVIPQEGRSLYDGFFTSSVGIIILVAPTVGNQIKNLIENNAEKIPGIQFPQFRLLFLIAAVLVFIINIYNLIVAKKKNNLEKEREFLRNILGKRRR